MGKAVTLVTLVTGSKIRENATATCKGAVARAIGVLEGGSDIMTKDQALRVIALGKRGCSVDMIKRTLVKEFHIPTPYSNAIGTVLVEAGITGYELELSEEGRYSDPEALRIRWDKIIGPMKAKLRASIGGV